MMPVLQPAGAEAGAGAGEPVALWLRGGAPRLLPLERPLAEAGVAAEATLDLAAALPRVRALPSRVACAVPDGSSAAVSLRPPGAFSVSARV